jgi:hypothetical protein
VPRIEWDVVGTHVYETGIDHGMLYVDDNPGVPWNGLMNVTEASTGGTAREFFIDGEKYLNLPSLEEYLSTVTVVSVPREFAPCAGWKELFPGTWATNQPRKEFGFSYRTLIGDDLQGLSGDYKIHVVYNASAKVSDIIHQTTSKTPNFRPYSFEVTAVPEPFIDYKPSAHFVIDSRKIPEDMVTAITEILYGTDTADPRLPDVAELMNILVSAPATGGLTMSKMIVAISGKTKSVGTGIVSVKKMRPAGTGAGKPRITAAIRMKKMGVSVSVTAVSKLTSNPRMKKMKVSASVTTPFTRNNTLEGGTNATTITTANSGGASGNAFDSAQVGGTNGVCSYENTRAFAGTLSAAIASGTTSVDPYIGWTLIGGQPVIWGRFYAWVTANPAANWRIAAVYGTAPNVNMRAFIRFTTTGKLVVLDSASTVVYTTTASFPLNQWTRVEYMVVGSASAGQIWIAMYNGNNASPIEQNTSAASFNTAGEIASVLHGIASPQANVAKAWFDNLAISTVGPIGP